MTIQEARAALARPLTFGDTAQIEALIFLAAVEHANQHVARCKRCNGTGRSKTGRVCRGCTAHYALDVLLALNIKARPLKGDESQPKLI